ncbi:MAG: hypothetical protein ACKVOA_06875 [Methylophilaceae bacterium]
MATTAKITSSHSKRETPSTMLLKFKHKDTVMGVQKQTVKRMAELLGFNETDVVHFALSKLAREVIPAYEMDDGPLTESQINKIKTLSGINQNMPMTSTLFG